MFVLSRFGGSGAALANGATVLLDVALHCLFVAASGMRYVARRDVSMAYCCFMASSLVM